jgi:two-component system sensor histidine kinase VicK
MFEGVLAAPLHFTIEFIGFVVNAGAILCIASSASLIAGRPIARVTAILGFVGLAAASVLHGASFIEAEGDAPLISLRAIGFVFVALAIASGTPTTVAPALLASQRPLLYAPAGSAGVLAAVALLRARSPGQAVLVRLALAAACYAAAEFIVAGAAEATIRTAEAEVYAAHGLRLLGHAALSWWLMTAVRSSVRSRFVAAFAALLVVVVLALSTTLTVVLTDNIESQELGRIKTQLSSAVQNLEDDEQALSRLAQRFSQANDVRAAVAAGGRLDELAKGTVSAGIPPVDFVVLATPAQRVGYQTGAPDEVTPLRDEHVQSVLASEASTQVIGEIGRVAVSIDEIGRRRLCIIAAAEISRPAQGGRAGIVAMGRYLDDLLIEELSSEFRPAAGSLLIGETVVASALPRRARADLRAPANLRTSITTSEQDIADSPFFNAFAPLRSESAGPVLVLSAPAAIVSETQQDLTRNLFLIALAVGTVALVLAWLSGRAVTRPIQVLTSTARSVREGDLSVRTTVGGRDEVGQLGETFNDMTASLGRLTEDLRTAAREEQELRARIETIIQSMADGLIAVDAERRILAFNTEAELLTGVEASHALGRVVSEVIDVRDLSGERMHLPIERLEEGAVRDIYVTRRHGSPVPIAVTSATLRDEAGRVNGGVAVLRDMSREHELEKIKGGFLANVSHELRTPLTPIKGYAEMLAAAGVSAEKSASFGKGILNSTRRLERIVSLLIDYSAMEAGRLAPRTTSVDVAALVDRLTEEWAGKTPRHEVISSVASNVPAVAGDERLLRRSLDEVIDNAVKFSPDGGPIRVDVRANGRADRVEIAVSDRGVGVSPEDIPRMFYDFQQLEGSETRTYGGLGLGLAFVRRIIAAHNGDVSVQSVPDRGTKLTISLPASQPISGHTSL